jgi:serine/threonine protein kinase
MEFDPFREGEFDGYRLVREMGRGAMGAVYEAIQLGLKRPVALKVVTDTHGSSEIDGARAERFLAEQRALAVLSHASIAKVFDAGRSKSGRLYFSMELIRGRTIEKYCDDLRLPLSLRIRLIRMICDAVQHANARGFVHRDLKPSNLLVDESGSEPIPKVIDFGLVKSLGAALVEDPTRSSFSEGVGTPLYLSPEQALGGDSYSDARSDVYGIGATLYQLATGVLPFSAEQLGRVPPEDFVAFLARTERPRASTRFAALPPGEAREIARLRSTTVVGLACVLREDLDWILARSVSREKGERYATALELSEDLLRFLEGLPVAARPPSPLYRLRKLSRRSPRTVIAAGGVVVVAVAIVFLQLDLWKSIQGWFAALGMTSLLDDAAILKKVIGRLDDFFSARKALRLFAGLGVALGGLYLWLKRLARKKG